MKIYSKCFKRAIDLLISSFAFLFLLPLIILISVLVRIKLGCPIVFKQPRCGMKGKDGKEKVFTIYKFRTMIDKFDESGKILPDNARLTSFGKSLRATSADEILELINIIKGDMSIVGPRPLLVKYLPRYTEEQRHRHDMRPGLTGLAQIKGRNLTGWEDKFTFDIEYVKNVTFLGDCKIIFMTFMAVIRKEGITNGTSATMDEFLGSYNSEILRDNGQKIN